MPGSYDASWRALPAFIVRPAGFAFGRLAELRFVRSVAAAGELAAAARDRRAAGAALDEALGQERYRDHPAFDDPVARKQLSRHIKHARAFARGDGGPLPAEALAETARVVPRVAVLVDALRAGHDRHAAAARAFDAVFARELDDRRVGLRAVYAGDERLREAVFIESPEAFERILQLVASAGPRDVRARQRERLAAMYLQRFCAKNDTNSICGPHGVAWLVAGAITPRVAIAAGGEHRRSYFSHWAAERLLDEVSRRAGAELTVPVRVNPMLRLDGATASWCVIEHDATTAFRRRYSRANLPGPAVTLLDLLAQRPRTLAELDRLVAPELGLTSDEIAGLIDQLCAAGIAVRRAALPPGLFDPLAALAAMIDGWPREARSWGHDHVRTLQDETAGFAAARLPERVASYRRLVEHYRGATGDAAERGHGRHYADRMLVHEDCHAAIHAEIGAETLGPLLAALAPLLHAASLPLDLARESVRHWFRGRFGAGRRASAVEVHRAFDEERAAEQVAATPVADALRAGIARVEACFRDAIAAAAGGPARVSSPALAAALAGTPVRPGFVSVDVLLCRTGAAPALVLGEVHGFCWLPTCLLDVAPDRDRVVAAMRAALAALAAGRPTLEAMFAHTQATDRRFAIADADLVLIDAADRSAGRPSVRLGQLDVVLDGDELRFLDGEREVLPIATYTTYPFLQYTSPLAPLVDDFAGKFFPDALLPDAARAADAPRMLVDDLTFRRQSWGRPASELHAALAGKDGALLVAAQELRARLGCPATVFASLPCEPKPVLVDFDNFFLVESFAHLVARQAVDAGDAVVRLTEMLPGPDELFATGPDGPRTSELRMGFYRLPG